MWAAGTHYPGHSRKLVVALDIGTTFSGAAYAFLDPGEVPQIQSVTRYLNAPNNESAKVTSILNYDHDGNFCGVEDGFDFQDDGAFLRIRWWKLMISPMELSAAIQMCTQLPKGKTIVDVFADFMRYLFDSAKAHFISSGPAAEIRWNSVSNNIELVLTHPNEWGGSQQAKMRTAAVRAGIVPDTKEGHSRVHFVTEGEASFNFCVTHTQAGKDLKPGEQVLIVDAGGGTIDISTYKVLSIGPLQVEELFEPKCLLQGGDFVTARAREMVQEKLRGSRFNTPADLATFSQRFDEGLKRIFSNNQTDKHVRFGSPRDNDPNYGIKGGRLTLTGSQVSGFFEPSIQSTVDSIKNRFSPRLATNSFAFLVGGFAASPWLSKQLEERLIDLGLKFCKPETNTSKAVAFGAVSFYVDHSVTGRLSKFTYGITRHISYDPLNPEHVKREHSTFLDTSGGRRVPGYFETMVSRGTKVVEVREVRHSFCYVTEGAPQQQVLESIVKYTGTCSHPQWVDTEKDKFKTLCTILADPSAVPCQTKRTGNLSYMRRFDVILLFGPTEFKAQIGWIDTITGVEYRSDAVIIYEDPQEETA